MGVGIAEGRSVVGTGDGRGVVGMGLVGTGLGIAEGSGEGAGVGVLVGSGVVGVGVGRLVGSGVVGRLVGIEDCVFISIASKNSVRSLSSSALFSNVMVMLVVLGTSNTTV